MSKEARIQISLQIRKVSGEITLMDEATRPTAYQADVNGTKGPVPGDLTIPVGGESIDLSELDNPGLCGIMNRDSTNYVVYGILDVDADRFYPFGKLLAGEMTLFRFANELGELYEGTGTGTTSASATRLFIKANTAAVVVSVKAFDS